MSEKYDKYLNTYLGKEVIRKYFLEKQGTWAIYGYDPNCGMGGFHVRPLLRTFEGSLKDAIEVGVNLPGFWQWGVGGDFKLLEENDKKTVYGVYIYGTLIAFATAQEARLAVENKSRHSDGAPLEITVYPTFEYYKKHLSEETIKSIKKKALAKLTQEEKDALGL